MRSAAAAIAWEFRQRHRWGFAALAAYVVVEVIVRIATLHQAVVFRDEESFAFTVVVPMTTTFLYLLGVFTYGLSGDIAARQSMYPARMFTLPVSSSALAGLPMLYGTTAMAVLWFAMRPLATWPAHEVVPVFWPALLAASLLAWTQALTWMSYPLRGLRVVLTVLWLSSLHVIVLVALHFRARETLMLAILAPHVPLAFVVARSAVARARRGDIPDWSGAFGRSDETARAREPFSSAARAQMWFEWRQHGWTLPALVAIVVPCDLAMLFVFKETPMIIAEMLIAAFLAPPFLAAFVAAAGDSSGLTPFHAARPLTNAALIAPKLKATMLSAAVTWIFVLATVPVALRLSGTMPLVVEHMQEVTAILGPRAGVLTVLAIVALFLSTWKQLVQSLYIAMSGRPSVAKGSLFGMLAFLAVAFALLPWIGRSRRAIAYLWHAFPSILAVLVVLKVCAGAWVAIRLHRSGLLTDRALLIGAAAWDVIVFAIFGLFVWIFPMLIERSILACIAILFVPLARLAAAPLALEWNRHR